MARCRIHHARTTSPWTSGALIGAGTRSPGRRRVLQRVHGRSRQVPALHGLRRLSPFPPACGRRWPVPLPMSSVSADAPLTPSPCWAARHRARALRARAGRPHRDAPDHKTKARADHVGRVSARHVLWVPSSRSPRRRSWAVVPMSCRRRGHLCVIAAVRLGIGHWPPKNRRSMRGQGEDGFHRRRVGATVRLRCAGKPGRQSCSRLSRSAPCPSRRRRSPLCGWSI